MSGRPDERFPTQPTMVESIAGREVMVSVVANVNVTRTQGQIRFVNPLPAGRPSGIAEGSGVTLRALGAGGEQLREYPVRVNLSSELGPDDDREGIVDAVIPLTQDARAIDLAIGSQVVHSVRVGGDLPALRGVSRLTDAGDRTMRVGLQLDRSMEEGHTYAVQVSEDRGASWRTVAVGLTDPDFAIDQGQFRPGTELQVRVLATNGLSTAVVTTETLRVGE